MVFSCIGVVTFTVNFKENLSKDTFGYGYILAIVDVILQSIAVVFAIAATVRRDNSTGIDKCQTENTGLVS